MADVTGSFLREQLLDRRQRLDSAIAESGDSAGLVQLLNEVDSALRRMDNGSYGICEVCHESVEKPRLVADPLVRFCLDHLTADQQRALEQDLELASQLQRELLPEETVSYDGWQICYHYQPVGPVSGDYCDVIVGAGRGDGDGRELFFALGDASGKGVAASMLMAHLHAIFRTLAASGLPLHELVGRASRIFRDSMMSPYFATLVCGKANASGRIEICNAGHCPPLVIQNGKVTRLEASGLPLGLFRGGQYTAQTLDLSPGDSLFLYTDGLSEARSRADEEYGEDRVAEVVAGHLSLDPRGLIHACIKSVTEFRSGAPMTDDLAAMAVRRVS